MIEKIKYRFLNLSSNDKIILENVLLAFLVKGGALFITLFTLPVYIKFFKDDIVLGLWYTLLSLLNWILNFDLGIGNGLRNYLAITISKKNREKTKIYISSAYFSIGIIVGILCILFILMARFFDWNTILNISENCISKSKLRITIVIVFLGVMAHFWLRLVNSILYALQKSSINNFLVLITNTIILLVTLILPSKSNEINIINMAILHAVAVAFPLLICSWVIFFKVLPYAKPTLKFIRKKEIKDVLSLGGSFFFIQIAYMLIMSSNEFLIAKILSAKYVVDYQIYYRIFSLGSTIFTLALTPLWSAITKAYSEKNYNWIKIIYHRFILLAILFCLGEFLIIPFFSIILKVWLGGENNFKIQLVKCIAFSIFGSLMILNGVFSSIANGLGKLKVQSVSFTIGAIIKIPIAFLLIKICESWIGVIWANIICMSIYCIIQPIYLKKYLNNCIKKY